MRQRASGDHYIPDEGKGRLAVQELLAARLDVKSQVADVHEINDVARMMERIQSDYGRLDVLVNNAGVILDRGVSVLDVEESVVRQTLETNFWCFAYDAGGDSFDEEASLRAYRKHLFRSWRFRNHAGWLRFKGSSSAYRISKTMLNALTCLVSQEVAGAGIKINAVCPGRVQTDMGGEDAPLTVAEGADTAVWLATMEEDGPSGSIFESGANRLVMWWGFCYARDDVYCLVYRWMTR